MVDYIFNNIVNQTVTFIPDSDTVDFGPRSAATVIFALSGLQVTATSTIGRVTFDSTLVQDTTSMGGFTLTNTRFDDGSLLAVGELTEDIDLDEDDSTLDFTTDPLLTGALDRDNQVHGLGGNDTIIMTGSTGDNLIYGGADADSIIAGLGNNTIFGGVSLADTTDGDDQFVVGSGSNVIYGNGGADAVTFSTVTIPGQTLTFYGGTGADSLTADSSRGAFLLHGGPGDDNLALTSLQGTATVYGGVNSDTLDFSGTTGNITVYGGNSAVDSADGGDTITLGQGNATVYANAGTDRLTLGAASSKTVTAYLGKGADTVTSAIASGQYVIYGGTDGDNINLANHSGNATVFGGSGISDSADTADTITGSSSGSDIIYGNGGTDLITVTTGTQQSSSVYGGAGNDTIAATPTDTGAAIALYGNVGDDTFRLNFTTAVPILRIKDYSGKDITAVTLSGGDAAHLTVERSLTQTIIKNGTGEQIVYEHFTGNFSDTSFVISNGSILETNFASKSASLGGGTGNDQLIAGDFGDSLTAGAGIDLLTGGSGNDKFFFKTADLDPNDSVTGSGGTDILSLGTPASAIVDIDFLQIKQVETLVLESGDYSTLSAITLGAQASASGIVTVDASAATATAVNLSLMTHGITFLGATAVDSIIGTQHDDNINGKAGADIIAGANGNDTIIGGDGSDVFVYENGVPDGSDTLRDVNFGSTSSSSTNSLDKILFDASADGLDLGNNNDTIDGAILTTIMAAGDAGTELIILRSIGIATADISAKLDIINTNVAELGGSVSVFFDTTKGHAVMYYDENGPSAGGHHLLADITSVTTLAGMNLVDFTDFVFVA